MYGPDAPDYIADTTLATSNARRQDPSPTDDLPGWPEFWEVSNQLRLARRPMGPIVRLLYARLLEPAVSCSESPATLGHQPLQATELAGQVRVFASSVGLAPTRRARALASFQYCTSLGFAPFGNDPQAFLLLDGESVEKTLACDRPACGIVLGRASRAVVGRGTDQGYCSVILPDLPGPWNIRNEHTSPKRETRHSPAQAASHSSRARRVWAT